jgi:outer membrane protein TolC
MGCNLVMTWRKGGPLRLILASGLLLANVLFCSPRLCGSDEPTFLQQPVVPLNKDNAPPNQGQAGGLELLRQGPTLPATSTPPQLPPAQLEPTDLALPINLASALRLAGARPLIISAAETSVQAAAAQLAQAKVAWLPSIYTGAGYYRHDGATQGQSGNFYENAKEEFMAGGGMVFKVSSADAIFKPLAAQQTLRSRQIDVQTARNDALLAVAQAYFNVQQARGILAGAQDVIGKSHAVGERVAILEPNSIRATDLHRALAQLAEFEEAVSVAREQWRTTSVDLTQVLRLNPTATVVPVEPPHLRVTLVPEQPVDSLIPIGLVNRPELASQQALVQAALVRIRQERLRPLMPSLLIQGNAGPAAPGGYLMGGVFASNLNSQANPTAPRDDISVELVWGLENLGFGNRAQVRERRAEQQQLTIEFSRIQDMVAAEIARSHAQIESATRRVSTAEKGLDEAQLTYNGSMEELGKTVSVNNVVVALVTRRAFEVVDALRSLSRAYEFYFNSVADFNRAQFRLYRALGYPAGLMPSEAIPGNVQPIDTSRPQMPEGGAPVRYSSHR